MHKGGAMIPHSSLSTPSIPSDNDYHGHCHHHRHCDCDNCCHYCNPIASNCCTSHRFCDDCFHQAEQQQQQQHHHHHHCSWHNHQHHPSHPALCQHRHRLPPPPPTGGDSHYSIGRRNRHLGAVGHSDAAGGGSSGRLTDAVARFGDDDDEDSVIGDEFAPTNGVNDEPPAVEDNVVDSAIVDDQQALPPPLPPPQKSESDEDQQQQPPIAAAAVNDDDEEAVMMAARDRLRHDWMDTLDLHQSVTAEEHNEFRTLRKLLGIDRLSFDTLLRYNVKGHLDSYDHPALCYPRYRTSLAFTRNRVPNGLKVVRKVGDILEKEDIPEPDPNGRTRFSGIFGYHLVNPSDHSVVLTTNERDAMAVYEETNLLSLALPNAEKIDYAILPYMEEFDTIVLWFPKIHHTFAKEYAGYLGLNRCSIVTYPDRPIELIRKGLRKEIPKAITLADKTIYRNGVERNSKGAAAGGLSTIVDVRNDIRDELIQHRQRNMGICEWKRFPVLNRYLGGFRPRELTVLTGGTGHGKTTFICESAVDLLVQGVRTLFCSFEIEEIKILKWMLLQFAGMELYHAEHEDEIDAWLDKFQRTKGLLFLMRTKEFEKKTIREIAEAIREQVIAYDIQHVVIDNLQFLVGMALANKPQASFTARYQEQDKFVGMMRNIASKTSAHVTLVVHPRKIKPGEDITIHDFGGTGRITQEADNILIIQRHKEEDGKVHKYLQIVKNRYGLRKVEDDRIEMIFVAKTNTHQLIERWI